MKFSVNNKQSIFLGHILLLLSFLFFTGSTNRPSPQGNGYKIKTVVIDAGHGGTDPGCLGTKINEKAVALGIALKLGKYIEENFKDVKVIYTRSTDVFIPLHERAKIANDAKADLFISIHANSNESKTPYGTETYVMGVEKYVANNLDIVQRENSVIYLEEDHEKNYEKIEVDDPIVAKMSASAFQKVKQDQSLLLAGKIQEQFETRLKLYNRGVKQRVLFVMYKTAMPSVLVETGFLSNLEDEKYLASEKGQAYVASAIFRAFKIYKMQVEGSTATEIKTAEEQDYANQTKVIKSIEEKKDTVVALPKDTVIKKVPVVSGAEPELIFKVQLTSSSKKIELTSHKFKGFEEISFYESDGTFKYVYGKAKSMEEAVKLQNRAKEGGYADAFVVAFYKGERVSMKRAKELLGK
ncbi:MAG: N-acetylmuramoyl-L-alanine amidase [Bacteroidetes bacterium]|nr:N-acetylmuramoyl-L-alanine amidase [Bacteroidota bacterium]